MQGVLYVYVQVTEILIILQIQSSNYASFYDDTRQNWSLMFDSEEQLKEFAKQVTTAIYHNTRRPPQPGLPQQTSRKTWLLKPFY